MKKLLACLLALLLAAPAVAEEPVYVSLTDDTGALVLAYAPVALTDMDGDGVLSIHDALFAAHEAWHPEGAAAYLAERTEFGMSLYVLWGADNGGSYGYCVNDAAAMSLLDPVQPGDHVKAYAYTDLTAWSDVYSYFAAPTLTVKAGETAPLTLVYSGFDANWAPVTLPAAGAALTVNGEDAGVATDAAGTANLTFPAAGAYIVSAVSQTLTLVAPVCIVTVE